MCGKFLEPDCLLCIMTIHLIHYNLQQSKTSRKDLNSKPCGQQIWIYDWSLIYRESIVVSIVLLSQRSGIMTSWERAPLISFLAHYRKSNFLITLSVMSRLITWWHYFRACASWHYFCNRGDNSVSFSCEKRFCPVLLNWTSEEFKMNKGLTKMLHFAHAMDEANKMKPTLNVAAWFIKKMSEETIYCLLFVDDQVVIGEDEDGVCDCYVPKADWWIWEVGFGNNWDKSTERAEEYDFQTNECVIKNTSRY